MKSDQIYDLAIIGGGINGASIARDAAMRGMDVILLEKEDFGYGASSKTSKLAHGGLRYLEHFKFPLVKEALYERSLLLQNASHLVKPLAFVIPVYSQDPYPLWLVKGGLYLYDYLGKGEIPLPKHQSVSKEEIINLFPDIRKEGLKGGCIYYDALMKDNRILIENILSAEQKGAKVCNYSSVTGIVKENDRLMGLKCVENNVERFVKAKAIVNATGAWSNKILNRDSTDESFQVTPTKGVHLVIPQVTSQHALILRAPQDNRIFFLIPWEGNTLLGTTDTYFSGDPDKVEVEEQDIKYLSQAYAHYFPNKTALSIISAFAGLRPLIRSNIHHPSSISRDYAIHTSSSGLISVLGGKFTTHRKIAEEVVNHVADFLKIPKGECLTKNRPLLGSLSQEERSDFCNKYLKENYLNEEQVNHLLDNYGKTAFTIMSTSKHNQPFCSFHPHIIAELIYSIKYEHTRTLEDWFFRRTSIGYSVCQGKHCVEVAAKTFSSHLHWSEKECQQAIQHYLKGTSSL